MHQRLHAPPLNRLKAWLGIELSEVSGREKMLSAIGGLISLLLLTWACAWIDDSHLASPGAVLMIASMGASAVLLFAVPHGQLSQPWPVIAGHTISAAIGVACAQAIHYQPLAAGCAVGLAILAMHFLKCIHPPGGATALTAVIGGPTVRALGFYFVWCPVLANALLMVVFAVAFNAFFSWRRYPASLNRSATRPPQTKTVSHEAVVAALRSLDSFVDITEADLIALKAALENPPQEPAAVKGTDLP